MNAKRKGIAKLKLPLVAATTAPKAIVKPKPVKFAVSAPKGSAVFLAGSFNNWAPNTITLEHIGDGFYTASVPLPPGRHEYKFVINGTWCADPACPDWVKNNVGTLNSVCKVS